VRCGVAGITKLHLSNFFARFRHYVNEQNQTTTEEQSSYEQKERQDLCRRILDFHARFGYAPVMFFGDGGQAAPVKRPDPEPTNLLDLAEAAKYLNLTNRQLRNLCHDQNITHGRIDYRTYRFRKEDLDEWFDAYKVRRKSVYG